MEIDKFGRTSVHLHRKHKLNEDHVEYNISELNIKQRRITNLDPPIQNNDAASKEYVDHHINELKSQPVSNILPQSQVELQENLNANKHIITNLGDGIQDVDAVNIKVMKSILDTKMKQEKLKLKTIIQNAIFGTVGNTESVERDTVRAKHPVKNIDLYLWLSKWHQEK
jgi:hypothetical protein